MTQSESVEWAKTTGLQVVIVTMIYSEPIALNGFPQYESSRICKRWRCFQPAGEEWRKIGAGGLLEHFYFHIQLILVDWQV